MPIGVNPAQLLDLYNPAMPQVDALNITSTGTSDPYSVQPVEPIPQQQIPTTSSTPPVEKYTNDNSPYYLKDVPMPLSQNNPLLACFPKKGKLLVPTQKLIAEAVAWENQEALRLQGVSQQMQKEQQVGIDRSKMAAIVSKALYDASAHPDIMANNRDSMEFYNNLIPMVNLPGGENVASSLLNNIGGLYGARKQPAGLTVNPYQYAQKLSDDNPYRNMLLQLGDKEVPHGDIEKLMNQADDCEKTRSNNSIEWAKLNKDNKNNPAFIGLKEFTQNYYIPVLRQQGLQVQLDKNGAVTAILDGKGKPADKSKIPTPEQVLRNITTPEMAQKTVASWFDPQGIGGLSDLPTTMSKRGRSMVNKIPSNAGFSKQDYIRADQFIVENNNSFRKAFLSAISNKDKALIRALRWRYCQLSGKDINEQELYSLLSNSGGNQS